MSPRHPGRAERRPEMTVDGRDLGSGYSLTACPCLLHNMSPTGRDWVKGEGGVSVWVYVWCAWCLCVVWGELCVGYVVWCV